MNEGNFSKKATLGWLGTKSNYKSESRSI